MLVTMHSYTYFGLAIGLLATYFIAANTKPSSLA